MILIDAAWMIDSCATKLQCRVAPVPACVDELLTMNFDLSRLVKASLPAGNYTDVRIWHDER